MSSAIKFKRRDKGRLISEEERASSVFPVLAYDEESFMFYTDDKSLAFGFVCSPLTGMDEQIELKVRGLLNDSYPANTQMQIIWFRSPDINADIMRTMALRAANDNPNHNAIIAERTEFLKKYTHEPLIGFDDKRNAYNLGVIQDTKILVTVKIPIQTDRPTAEDVDEIRSIRTSVNTTLESTHMRPQPITADTWVRLMNVFLNWGLDSSWQHEACQWDETKPLCEQVLDYDNDIELSKHGVRVGEMHFKSLSAKRLPEQMYFGDAMSVVGDLSGGLGGVKNNFFVCTNIVFPQSDSTRQSLDRKRQFAVNQASGPIVRFVPILLDKKADFDALYDSINMAGMRPLQISYHVVVFGRSVDEVDRATVAVRNQWRARRFELMPDSFVQMPVFINCMPFCCDKDAIMDLRRHKTMSGKEAAPLVPIFGEWKGTGTPHLNLVSRNGQVMSFSLHDTGSNMNGVIAAQSGMGKSFVTNELISSYMSVGAQVWVIDVGKSYERLCELYAGDFVQFGSNSKSCLNPFPLINSLDGTDATRAPGIQISADSNSDDAEEDAILGILIAMAVNNEQLSDLQTAELRRILNEQWRIHFRDTTVDHIEQACLQHKDSRVRDVGTQLYPFTSKGAYSRFFSGPNTVDFKNQFTVLELEELKGRAHLQKVVLLQLIYQIQQEMYHGDRSKKKLVIIDEAWDLLSGGDISKFIINGYRRFRKYGGSVVIVTQSINDLYSNSTGQAIAENSATTLLLGQKRSTIVDLQKSGRVQLSDWQFEQLKTVHTVKGVYSEMYIMSEGGNGIGRLVVSDKTKLIYSTTAEEVGALNKLQKSGLTMMQAVQELLRQRNEQMGRVA